jgi:hypothetical protein
MAVLAIANPIWGIITACPSLNVIDGTKAYGGLKDLQLRLRLPLSANRLLQ